MMDLNYQSMKIAHQAREADEMKTEMRKKNLLVLIYHHLLGQGYVSSALALDQETNGDVRRFEVCDNIDLETVLMEYESYHYVKFQKYPKITRRGAETGENSRCVRSGVVKKSPCSAVKPLPKISPLSAGESGKGAKRRVSQESSSTPAGSELVYFGPSVSSIRHGQAGEAVTNKKEWLLKPHRGFYQMDGDMENLAAMISRDIDLDSPNVRWEDVIGLEDAKRCVREAVVYPIKYPELFKGVVDPWRGLLLYGPPGTGKTLLAKAVATESKTTFFNISASTIVSKWRGESEKLVRVLFELARFHAPSTIFIDELESVMGQRGSGMGGDHEGSRRLKAELLIQMDGLARTEDLVFVLAASNLPWELDHAMLRRLEKRILVSLPSQPARQAMISHWLPPIQDKGGVVQHTALDYELLSEETEGYSGSDVRLLCREAAMRPVRKIIDVLESHQDDTEMPAMKLETITTADFLAVIAHTKPSARNLTDKYTAWELEYESV